MSQFLETIDAAGAKLASWGAGTLEVWCPVCGRERRLDIEQLRLGMHRTTPIDAIPAIIRAAVCPFGRDDPRCRIEVDRTHDPEDVGVAEEG